MKTQNRKAFLFIVVFFLNPLHKKTFHFHCRADGTVNISTTVPDTITSWIASAFAVNSVSGLGVSPTTAKVCITNNC